MASHMDFACGNLDWRKIIAVFLAALLVRVAVLVVVSAHPLAIFQPDSKMYVALARGLLQTGSLISPEIPAQLDAMRMPGYPFFLAVAFWLFGETFVPVVAFQALTDSFSCVLIARLSEMVWKGSGLLTGLLSAVNMTMVTYANFILNDSLFLFAFTAFLLRSERFFHLPTWKNGCAVGLCLGLAAWIRPVILYLPFILMPFSFVYLVRRAGSPAGLAFLKTCLIVILFLGSLAPWAARNYAHWGKFRLTAQNGEHLLQYVVPFVWQYSKATPFIEGMSKVNEEFTRRAGSLGFDQENRNQFEVSDFQSAMALQYLKDEPRTAIMKAWLVGILKNLFAPAVVDFSYLLDVRRPHFFSTQGATVTERAKNFILGGHGFFAWALLGSIVILLVSRAVQIWGLLKAIRRRPWICSFWVLIIFYFLIISGPVGYAKYRLPFEPILIVLLAIGLRDLWERIRGRRSEVGGQRAAREHGA